MWTGGFLPLKMAAVLVLALVLSVAFTFVSTDTARAASKVTYNVEVDVSPETVSEGESMEVHVRLIAVISTKHGTKEKEIPNQSVGVTITWPDGSHKTVTGVTCKAVKVQVPTGVGTGEGAVDAEIKRGPAKGETGNAGFDVE